MTSRDSRADNDGLVWNTASLRLGQVGLDLRRPAEPPALAKLNNARFLDERTIERRPGHTVSQMQDAASFPPLGNDVTPSGWVYGHGQKSNPFGPTHRESFHFPIAGRGGSLFDFNGGRVAWTGDRLLVERPGGTAVGRSAYWNRKTTGDDGVGLTVTNQLDYGIPAFFPVQTDSPAPNAVNDSQSAVYTEVCLTPTEMITVDTGGGTVLNAYVVNRANGAVVRQDEISGASNAPTHPRVFISNGLTVALWLDTGDSNLYVSSRTTAGWASAGVLVSTCTAFDVYPVPGGFHLLYATGGVLKLSRFSGVTVQQFPYPSNSVVSLAGHAPNASCALGVAPDDSLCVIWEASTGLYMTSMTSTLATTNAGTQLSASTTWNGGLSVCSRGLIGNGGYDFIVHASRGFAAEVHIWTVLAGTGTIDATTTTRFNCVLRSKSFRVGNEVFCWLTSFNASTHYLLAGVLNPIVVGYADREESAREPTSVGRAIAAVQQDPLDTTGTRFSWIRAFQTNQNFVRGGTVRFGYLDFLPRPTIAHYGKSVYISGSAVRNWDGTQLNDAGWQDFPVVTTSSQTTGGSPGLTQLKMYFYRVKAVRYNALGERFESAAKTFAAPVLTGTNNKITLTIQPVTSTSHTDVQLEVYRTEGGGTTFYLEGVIANDLTVATVSFVSQLDDATLITQAADPTATGVGNLSELESFGPLGCSLLVSAADRLWGAGGQVPTGIVQFSKLWEGNFGAGFDDLGGFQVVDIEGGDVTSIAAFNDAIVLFQRERLFVFGGSGPDNDGVGGFSIPEIRLADGAITHFGTLVVPDGLLYWGSDGPRLLGPNFRADTICAPVRPLTATLTPVGVRSMLSREEVVWYTADGTCLLWNYRVPPGRWATWSGLPAAAVCDSGFISPDGTIFVQDETVEGDGGRPYAFEFATGNIRPGGLLQDHTRARRVGITGDFNGDHELRMRVFYNGSPLWSQEFTWQPTTQTFLAIGDTVAALTPAQIDAFNFRDKSGAYGTHHRLQRQDCQFFSVEVSDINATTKTFTPFELSFEIGALPGLGRVPVGVFS